MAGLNKGISGGIGIGVVDAAFAAGALTAPGVSFPESIGAGATFGAISGAVISSALEAAAAARVVVDIQKQLVLINVASRGENQRYDHNRANQKVNYLNKLDVDVLSLISPYILVRIYGPSLSLSSCL